MKTLKLTLGFLILTQTLQAGDIDLSTVPPLAPKGRIQDKEYNGNAADPFISAGTKVIPFLIGKLSDKTIVQEDILNYWPANTVGDIALVILTDLTTDSKNGNSTIPGTSPEELFGYDSKSGASFRTQFQKFVEKGGRGTIQKRWETAWKTYESRVYWDAKERCFRIRAI